MGDQPYPLALVGLTCSSLCLTFPDLEMWALIPLLAKPPHLLSWPVSRICPSRSSSRGPTCALFCLWFPVWRILFPPRTSSPRYSWNLLGGKRLGSSLGSLAKSLMTLAAELPTLCFTTWNGVMGWMAPIHFSRGHASDWSHMSACYHLVPHSGRTRVLVGSSLNNPGSVFPTPYTYFTALLTDLPTFFSRVDLIKAACSENTLNLGSSTLERHCVLTLLANKTTSSFL